MTQKGRSPAASCKLKHPPSPPHLQLPSPPSIGTPIAHDDQLSSWGTPTRRHFPPKSQQHSTPPLSDCLSPYTIPVGITTSNFANMNHPAFQIPGMPPAMINQPPQIFGYDGMPAITADMASQMFSDNMLLDDTVEAKRRRIAKASFALTRSPTQPLTRRLACRPVTCAARRRSSATESCPPVDIVPTTRPNAYSRKLRRSALPPRGMSYTLHGEPGFLC